MGATDPPGILGWTALMDALMKPRKRVPEEDSDDGAVLGIEWLETCLPSEMRQGRKSWSSLKTSCASELGEPFCDA